MPLTYTGHKVFDSLWPGQLSVHASQILKQLFCQGFLHCWKIALKGEQSVICEERKMLWMTKVHNFRSIEINSMEIVCMLLREVCLFNFSGKILNEN